VARADVTVVPRSSRPNILLILVDDLDAKLGTINYMAHLQELLAAQGLSLDDFMISTPVCCPSRASFLRGQYAQNHQVLTNSPPLGGFEKFYSLQEESSTLATWLQAAGYDTVLLGKYQNGYPYPTDRTYIPPGWNEWYSPAQGSPYLELNYTLNENGKLVGYGIGTHDYMTDVLSGKTVDFIRRSVSDPRPFFIYLAPYAPHEPAIPALRHQDLFQNLEVPRTPSFNEADVSDKPANIAADPLLNATQIANLDNLYRQRVRSMQAVDEMIATLVTTLKETGQLDNTYIIFTSDNGYHLGQHRLLAGKGEPYEEDTVVPFIIRGPGIPAGEVLPGYLAGNTDVAPTIAELAGVIPPAFVDGRSLVPLWSAVRPPQTDWRQGYLLEYYGAGDSSGSTINMVGLTQPDQLLEPPDPDKLSQALPPGGFFAIRTSRYTYAEYESGYRELYDRSLDPYELNNIASSAEPGLLSQFSAWLKTLVSCSGASCRLAEQTGIH
jgi:arylsulfatase A-like enzyme